MRLTAVSVPRHRAHLLVAAVVLALDQASKAWAVDALADGHEVGIVWTLQLRLVGNTGASFSVGPGLGPWIGLAALVIAVALVLFGPRMPTAAGQVAVGLVLGGALGNVADRALRDGDGLLGGAVVDFIDLQWWPVFNVADMGVVLGGLLLVWATRDVAPQSDDDAIEVAREH